MSEKSNAPHITVAFNCLLFLYLAAAGIILFILSSKSTVSAEAMAMTIAIDAVRAVIVLLITAAFIKEFWRRLLANLFPVRAITYQEAIAIVLIIMVLFVR